MKRSRGEFERKRKEIISVEHGEDMDDVSEDEMVGKKALLKGNQEAKPVTTKNKQRVLIITSRGITHRYRHLMNDFHALLPHSKKEGKIDSKSHLEDLNELAELHNCNNCLYFEVRKHQDMYLWLSKTPSGPSVKFLVKNVHTMDELKLTGNCLKGSRPVLSFDATFDQEPHFKLLKELFVHTFGVPKTSRKIKPFIVHVMSFTILDNKIWIRNYQIVENSSAEPGEKTTLSEIGPRCVLDIIRIFDGSFGGSTLFENETFVTPNTVRRIAKEKVNKRYAAKKAAEQERITKKMANQLPEDPLAGVFE